MKVGLALLIGVFALSGCKGEPKSDAGAGTAQGEVLPGAASDAMLPLDTVKSQAPLAQEGVSGDPRSAKSAKSGKPKAVPSAASSLKPAPTTLEASPAETPFAN
jgi:hypothetical protein